MVHFIRVSLVSLQARVEDLQEYVEILKGELESSKKREKARKVGNSRKWTQLMKFAKHVSFRTLLAYSRETWRDYQF